MKISILKQETKSTFHTTCAMKHRPSRPILGICLLFTFNLHNFSHINKPTRTINSVPQWKLFPAVAKNPNTECLRPQSLLCARVSLPDESGPHWMSVTLYEAALRSDGKLCSAKIRRVATLFINRSSSFSRSDLVAMGINCALFQTRSWLDPFWDSFLS